MLMVPFVLGFAFLGVCLFLFYFKCFNSNYPDILIKNNIIQKHDDIGLLNLPNTFPKHHLVEMRPMCVEVTCVFVETELEVSLTLHHQTCSVTSIAV